jgi:Homing endonuclease associated repeat
MTEIHSISKVTIHKEQVQKIMSDLHRIKALNDGQYFSYLFYKQNKGLFVMNTLKKYLECKSWQELIEKKLGLYKSKITHQEVLDEIKNVWDQLGRRPTYDEFKKNTTISMTTLEKRFNTWGKAIEKFCLLNKNYTSNNAQISYHNSKSVLIKELKKIAKSRNNKIISYTNYKKNGGNYSIYTFVYHFGSWRKALESIGFKASNKTLKLPEQELLLAELQRIWEQIGRMPSSREIENISKYPYRFYLTKFGGRKKMIHACMDYLKAKQESET